jgi:hypothetical protein
VTSDEEADMRNLWRDRLLARSERGDVPGWVMITVMTIVIASAILVIFQERVTSFLNQTLDQYM